ncbi:MAG: hypothetical protein QMB76_00725 [Alphaproteobacteria bacterium]
MTETPRRGLLIVAGFALTACSLVQPTPAKPPPQPAATTQQTRIAPAQPRAAPPARRAPKASLADLLGSDAARIDTLLGAPEIVRREGPGELRLYRSTTCVLHVFLYPWDGAIRATHIEARTATVRLAAGETNSCVASFS